MMTWTQWGFQDAASPNMEEFLYFHDFAMVILCLIIWGVAVVLASVLTNSFIHKTLLEAQTVEFIWTLAPAAVLVELALPSLLLLYMLDDSAKCSVTLKTVGHQWYWTYEYWDLWQGNEPGLWFDSYMCPSDSLNSEMTRLLDVDNRSVLPFNTHVRVLITSADVLHSWTVPSLGVKADACPGRLNQVNFLSHRPGLFFGQCSEICGANHSFMPIALELVSSPDFVLWILALAEQEQGE